MDYVTEKIKASAQRDGRWRHDHDRHDQHLRLRADD
jgi:hypothetical protein